MEVLVLGRLIARENGEAGDGAEFCEGISGTIVWSACRFGRESALPHAGFEGPETTLAPLRGRHLAYAGVFEGIRGLKF